ncbi:MAG: hypothetical protein J6B85_04170 [Lachnospiraceae bacterium]|nr:hypothetical protein [Lachnospiraceae bacterium]
MRIHEGTVGFEDKVSFLKIFSQFNETEQKKDFVFSYQLQDYRLDYLKKKYNYTNNIDINQEFRSMVALTIWVNEHLVGDGMCIPPSEFHADYILESTKTMGLHSNCYMHAVVLNEVFLSVGFFSRMVRCMPVDLNYNDCHCVTEAFSFEWNKWIVFDASNRAYYINKKRIPLNLIEIREHIANKKQVLVPMMGRARNEDLIQYLAGNLVRFESFKESKYGNECGGFERTLFHFQSQNYPISDKKVFYPESGEYINHVHTSNPHLFWAPPLNDKI